MKRKKKNFNAPIAETTMFAISYLVGVRILSVSSISHLFHAIKRQSQADEEQEAADKRRHHVKRKRGGGECALPLRAPRRQRVSIREQPLLVRREEGRTRRTEPASLRCSAGILTARQELPYMKQQTHTSSYSINQILLKFNWTDTKCNLQDRLK